MATTIDMFPVHKVPISRPFIWLERGWDDLRHAPLASLAYGWLIASLGALILAYSRHPLILASAILGFLLVGPVVTAGVCELSRRRDHGDTLTFQDSLRGLAAARRGLLGFSALLLLLAMSWFALSALLLSVSGGGVAPDIGSTVWGNVAARLSIEQVSTYAAAFVVLACTVFAVSVVSVPMLIDRHVDAATAIRMSLRVTARDFPAMLGHATWHAYRDIVEEA